VRTSETARPAPLELGLALAALSCLVLSPPAGAQSNDEIQTGVQFNFLAPGARSLGLGGAFLGLADDATAAYANPAGLTQLVEPEVSIEGRSWEFTSLFVECGNAMGEPTGVGIDVVNGLRQGEMGEGTQGFSFLSYVHVGNRWAFSVYRHELARFSASLRSEGIFFSFPDHPGFRTSPVRSHLELGITGFGLVGAWELSNALSLGLGAASYDFHLTSITKRFAVQALTGDPQLDALPGGKYGSADFSAGNVLSSQIQDGEESGTGVHAGILWRPNRRWSVGAVYRNGPEFNFVGALVNGPSSPRPGWVDTSVGGEGTFHVPDVWGLGIALRVSERFIATLDWDHVDYSDSNDDMLNMIRIGRSDPENYVIDNGDEIHLGFEYLTLRPRHPVGLRLGVWRDPNHKIHYTGERELSQARFLPGTDEIHISGGLGIVIGRSQFDIGLDLSDRVDTLSFSTVASF